MDIYTTNPAELAQTPLGAGFVDTEKLPWVDVAPGVNIQFKVASCCNKTGRYVLLSKYAPGTQIATHRHSGAVIAITLQGSWTYLEEDFVATKGCIAFETANSNHTLKVLDDSEEELILLTIIEGSLVSYDDKGHILGIHDAQSHLQLYLALAAQQGLDIDESLIYRH
jgi:2,4'-dihydroxyacetophenone dioxygenase